MTRNIDHALLVKAKAKKNDEFYTQMCDIERELIHYTDQFENKVVYCNCDDYKCSNFYKYFVVNFKKLGLKKLICSCYKPQEIDLFSDRTPDKAYYCEYDGSERVTFFDGDGDFRSQESIALLKQSDVVVTNPPFSLFREYIQQLADYNKKFLIIGNVNAITYKNVFNLIQDNKCWLGINLGRGISGFIVPKEYELYGTETKTDDNGNRIIATNGCLWLTNLDNKIRHEFINLKKQYKGNEISYPKFDNYDGINVNKTCDIPHDFEGAMGVPITFLHKFNPMQFEIIRFRKGDDDKDLKVNGKQPYFRILIRRRHSASIPSSIVGS